MASETKEIKDKTGPADNADAAQEKKALAKPGYAGPATPTAKAHAGHGFFTIYKKGQGYWTRLGTAIAGFSLGALTAWEIYRNRPFFGLGGPERAPIALAIAGGIFLLYAFFLWRLINKPSNADFLIATDGEMKKVNWTSRKDLIGSTKVVIMFMFMIAIFLALVDVLFSYFFYFVGVLHAPSQTIGGG